MARALTVLGFALVVLAGLGGYGVGAEGAPGAGQALTTEDRVILLDGRVDALEATVTALSETVAGVQYYQLERAFDLDCLYLRINQQAPFDTIVPDRSDEARSACRDGLAANYVP